MTITRLTYYSRICIEGAAQSIVDHSEREPATRMPFLGNGSRSSTSLERDDDTKLRHPALEDILIESVANNRRDDVTGALIHDDGWFAQVLEGTEAAVAATFERISRDVRHCDVRLVRVQPVSARHFATSWMTLIGRTESNADLFRHYGEGERFDPRLMLADRLADLVEALAARARGAHGRFLDSQPWLARELAPRRRCDARSR
jgi:hypothetical protein